MRRVPRSDSRSRTEKGGGAPQESGKGKGEETKESKVKEADKGKGKQQAAAGGKGGKGGKKDKKPVDLGPPVELVLSAAGSGGAWAAADARALKMFCLEAQVNHTVVEAEAAVAMGKEAVPRLVAADGTCVSQPAGIMRHLAAQKGNPMFPAGAGNAAALRVEQLLEWEAATLRPALAAGGDALVCLGALEGWLKESAGKYITGKGFTAADISIAMDLGYCAAVADGYPKVAAWLDTMRARPHYATATA